METLVITPYLLLFIYLSNYISACLSIKAKIENPEIVSLDITAQIVAKDFDASSLHERAKRAKMQLPDDGSGDVKVYSVSLLDLQ